jgi:hypothetical protein
MTSMPSGPGRPAAHLRVHGQLLRLIWRYPVVAGSVPIFIALAVPALRRKEEWVAVYVDTARVLLGGGDIYAPGHGYLYPPFAALLAVPFVPLSDVAARLCWYLANVVAIVYLLRSAWGLAGGSRLGSIAATDRRDWLAFGLGVLCVGPYVLNALAHQQTDVVIGALLTTGCLVVQQGRLAVGAALIGLAAAFKGPPLLLVGYFLFRRHWLSAGVILAVAIGVNVLPDFVARPQEGTWLGVWLRSIALPTQRLDVALGTWNADVYNIFNQSLAGTVQRVTHSIPVFTSQGLDFAVSIAPIGARALKAITYGSMLLMAAASIWTALQGEHNTKQNAVKLPSRTGIEMATAMPLVLLMSPMSGLAHFVVLAAPVFCLSRMAVAGGYRVASAAITVAAFAAVISKDLVGSTIYDLALWSGMPTAVSLILWLAGIAALASGDGAAATPAFRQSIFSRAHLR